MIFLTVGTQLGFDRLIRAVDEWASKNSSYTIFAQIGNGNYHPINMKWERFLSPSKFDEIFRNSKLIISHAGMGTILNALVHEKPIVVLPRLYKYQEHRNDHQLATAKRLRNLNGVYFASSTSELQSQLSDIDKLKCGIVNDAASFVLARKICEFLETDNT